VTPVAYSLMDDLRRARVWRWSAAPAAGEVSG
jgi:hypothetical protein